MDNKQITQILYNVMDNFMAENAWCGHIYGFEIMEQYHKPILKYLTENNIISLATKLTKSYENVVNEYELFKKDNKSFLKDNTEKIDDLDADYLDVLAECCKAIQEKLEIKDEYLYFN